jgi:hypothetical protein
MREPFQHSSLHSELARLRQHFSEGSAEDNARLAELELMIKQKIEANSTFIEVEKSLVIAHI